MKFMAAKPRPRSSRSGMNGAGARPECRTNSTSEPSPTTRGATNSGEANDAVPPPR